MAWVEISFIITSTHRITMCGTHTTFLCIRNAGFYTWLRGRRTLGCFARKHHKEQSQTRCWYSIHIKQI